MRPRMVSSDGWLPLRRGVFCRCQLQNCGDLGERGQETNFEPKNILPVLRSFTPLCTLLCPQPAGGGGGGIVAMSSVGEFPLTSPDTPRAGGMYNVLVYLWLFFSNIAPSIPTKNCSNKILGFGSCCC